jgi:iron complex outermembrane receptor protein
MLASLDVQYRSQIDLPAGGSVSSYTTINATLLGRRIAKHVDLSVSVYNLLDSKYFDPASGVTVQKEIQQDGRTFRIKMTWHPGEQ